VEEIGMEGGAGCVGGGIGGGRKRVEGGVGLEF